MVSARRPRQDPPDRSRIGRPGLRARIVIAFGLGAMLVSIVLAATAYGLARSNIIAGRERSALRTVAFNASQVGRRIVEDTESAQIQELLQGLSTPAGSLPLIRFEDQWQARNSLEFGREDVAESLLSLVVEQDRPAQMRYRISQTPFLVIGIPITDKDATYFEATPLGDVEDTLSSLGLALIGGGAVTIVAGAGLGFWVGRRVLLPLGDISEAAEAIAAGDLDTRLEAEADRDLGRLTTSFNRMAEGLQERIERDARFASEVSHELRSPLMTLTASVEVLLTRRDELPERSRTALDLLSTDVARFQQLVEDLLEISRFDVGSVSLELSQFEITEFVHNAVQAADTAGTVTVSYPDRVAGTAIRADKRRLARVIANLIDNASKYGNGASNVSIVRSGDRVQIAVEDNGPGVPEAERAAIFSRFSRGSEGGRRGSGTGVGLGLALVSEHVRLHDGRVWVEDRLDGASGSRFVVELPGVVT